MYREGNKTMKQFYGLLLILLSIMLGVNACVSPQLGDQGSPAAGVATPTRSTTTALDKPEIPTEMPATEAASSDNGFVQYERWWRDLACESVIEIDLVQASNNPAYLTHDIFWSFHMNFRAFLPETVQGDPTVPTETPLGCFRLFGRNEGGQFVPIDEGGMIVDGCHVDGNSKNLSFSKSELPDTSQMLTVTNPLSNTHQQPQKPGVYDVGVATFAGQASILCDNFSISNLTKQAVQSGLVRYAEQYVGYNYGTIIAELKSLAKEKSQKYDTLTIVAVGNNFDIEQASILSYEPRNKCCDLINFDIKKIGGSSVTFSSTLQGTPYVPKDPKQPDCTASVDQPTYLWADLGIDDPKNPAVNSKTGAYFRNNWRQSGDLNFYHCEGDVLGGADPITPVIFGTGPATLRIGDGLIGKLYGVLIDPPGPKLQGLVAPFPAPPPAPKE